MGFWGIHVTEKEPHTQVFFFATRINHIALGVAKKNERAIVYIENKKKK